MSDVLWAEDKTGNMPDNKTGKIRQYHFLTDKNMQ